MNDLKGSNVGKVTSENMHESSMKRMEWFTKNFLIEKRLYKVLDVGSYDVNGSYRKLFSSSNFLYTGLDMEDGPNVDIVPKKTYKWEEIEDDKYDVVISGQALEHIEFFWLTMSEITRVTKKDGLICIIAPNGFAEHRYPVDCWRFFTDGMVALARYNNLEILHSHTNCAPGVQDKEWYSKDEADTMIIALKKYKGETRIVNLDDYKCEPTDHRKLRGQMKTYEEHIKEQDSKIKIPNENYISKSLTRIRKKRINMIADKIIKIIASATKNLGIRYRKNQQESKDD